MKVATIYQKSTGEIVMTAYGPDEESLDLQLDNNPGCAILHGADLNGGEVYIKNGRAENRPRMSLSVSGDVQLSVNQVLLIEGIPDGAEVMHPDGVTAVSDGYVEWSTVEPGRYDFQIRCFPYKEESVYAFVGQV